MARPSTRSAAARPKSKSPAARGGKATGNRAKAAAPPEGMDDEVDDFLSKDKISVKVRTKAVSSDEESDEEQAVYDLAEASEEEDDEEESDEDDLHVDAKKGGLIGKMAKQAKALKAKLLRDGGGSDDEEEKGGRNSWGKRKAQYYDFDDVEVDSDEEEAARLEEEEAVRLQREAAAALQPEDFSDDEEEDDEATLGEAVFEGRKGKDKGGKQTVERVERDLAALKSHKGAAALLADAPELQALLSELTTCLTEVKQRVQPLLAMVQGGEFATEKGVSYLEAKHLLLLSYCMHIVFYLMLKAEGLPVKDHPVVLRLVELRLYLEKIRPIDKKMAYQIDKLLLAATKAQTDPQAAEAEAEAAAQAARDGTGGGRDSLSFKPNPAALVATRSGGGEGGVYRAPRIAPAAMGGVGLDGELEGAGVNKREARKALMSSRRAARSDLARELAEEVMDAPTEVRGEGEEVMSAFARREQRRMEARNEMEEEMFVRIPLSKVEKKRQAAQHRQVGALTQLADLGDEVADLVSNADALGTLAPRRRLDDIAAGLQLRPTVAAPSGDQDLPTREPLGERRAKFGRKAHALATMAAMHAGEDDDGDDAGPMEVDEDELYTQFAAKKAAKKEARDEAEGARENKPMAEEDADGRRLITRQIEKNRGLTPHRNKLSRNPRKKLREKFGKALVKRGSQVSKHKEGTDGGYGGETTGIKTKLSKSRRL